MNQQTITVKNLFLKPLLILLAFISANAVQAQNSKQDAKEAAVQKMIDSKQFIFKVQTVSPLRGGTRNVSSDYDLRVSGDSIVSYLPYFGRAYTAPIGTNDGGLNFTTTNFSYDVKKNKKEWDITILPKDAGDVRQMLLNVFTNGSARLQVLSNNRDAISYYGRIEDKK
jgi:hypothetical protein